MKPLGSSSENMDLVMPPTRTPLVTHLLETFTMKYKALFTLCLLYVYICLLYDPSIQWCESYSELLMVPPPISCFVKQAQVLLHISLTQPRRPFAFFIQLANFHPSINRKTVMQTVNFLLTLACLMKCNLVFKPFPEPILPSSPRRVLAATAVQWPPYFMPLF